MENFIKDRDLLTWRPPGGGESIVDLRERLNNKFLPEIVSEARRVRSETGEIVSDSEARRVRSETGEVAVLLVTHGLTMTEQHRILGDIASVKENFEMEDGEGGVKYSDNTAVTRYQVEVEEETNKIIDVKCLQYACNQHLK